MYKRFANIIFKNGEVLCIHYYRKNNTFNSLTKIKEDSYYFEDISDISYTNEISNSLGSTPTRIVIPKDNVFMIIESDLEPEVKEEEK